MYVPAIWSAFPRTECTDSVQQVAVYDSLNGSHGLAGWRWLYIICGCMTVPVGLVTFFFLPDTPHKTRAWFLTEEDKEMAVRRIEEAGKAPPAKLTWKKAGRILRGWSECSCYPLAPCCLEDARADLCPRMVAFRAWLCGESLTVELDGDHMLKTLHRSTAPAARIAATLLSGSKQKASQSTSATSFPRGLV